jgi:tol-pal system protein YbgF
MRTRFLAGVLLLSMPALAGAQNRQELQMSADLRMLQEQLSRLQLETNKLSEQIQIINRRFDDQTSTGQKQTADTRLLINNLQTSLNTVREKLDDNTVRVSQLIQELPAIRSGLGMLATQLNTLVGLLTPNDPSAPASSSAGQGGLGDVKISESPTALFQSAMADYTGNRLSLSIEGFTEFVSKYPDLPQAAEAQFWIGQSHYFQGQYKEAIEAYDKVVKQYKDSEKVPDAYYQQGLSYSALKQPGQAQQIFRMIVKEYPKSTSAILAQQKLTPAR